MWRETLHTRLDSRLLQNVCALHTCPFLLACCLSSGLVVVQLSVTSLWTSTRARVSLCLDQRDEADAQLEGVPETAQAFLDYLTLYVAVTWFHWMVIFLYTRILVFPSYVACEIRQRETNPQVYGTFVMIVARPRADTARIPLLLSVVLVLAGGFAGSRHRLLTVIFCCLSVQVNQWRSASYFLFRRSFSS